MLCIIIYIYADGHYSASRLSSAVTKVTGKLKELLSQFNCIGIHSLSWKDVTDLTSPVWYEGILQADTTIPMSVKLQAIKFYHLCIRSEEEIALLSAEMCNVVKFYCDEWKKIHDKVNAYTCTPISLDDTYTRGILAPENAIEHGK